MRIKWIYTLMQAEAKPPAAESVTPDGPERRIAIHELYTTLDSYADRMALRFAGPIALVCALLTWLLNWGRNPIPFVSDTAGFGVLIFFFTIVIGFGVGAVGFVVGVRYRNRLVEADLRRSWAWPVIPLALAYTLVMLLVVTIVLQFIDAAFKDLALSPLYAALVVGVVCGLVAYSVADHTMQITVRSVINIFAIILFAGIAFSAINVNNPLWWEESFSFLGEIKSTERNVFNVTLIISGVIFVILQQFFMDLFVRLEEGGLLSPFKTRLVRVSLIAIGVALALVGLFPFGVNELMNTLHSLSAYALVGILLAHMLFARQLLPYFAREFYAMTWLMIGGLVLALVLHFLGSINTVGIELIGFTVAGAWFMLFVDNVERLVDRTESNDGPITALYDGNHRPVQPLSGRQTQEDVTP